jgi:hypothetical protein
MLCAKLSYRLPTVLSVKEGKVCVQPKRNRVPPAFKHGVYAKTTILPGEDAEAFEKLHQDLIADFRPEGALEMDIVANIARLVWRKQNLETLRIAKFARAHFEWIMKQIPKDRMEFELLPTVTIQKVDPAVREAAVDAALRQAKKELGYTITFIENRDIATYDSLSDELEIEEKINALIEKSLKRLFLVKGMKSISATSIPAVPASITGPRKSDDLKAA